MKLLWIVLAVVLLASCGSTTPQLPAASPAPGKTPTEKLTAPPGPTATPDAKPTPPPGPEGAQPRSSHRTLMDDVIYARLEDERAPDVLEQIAASGDTRYVAALIDSLRFQPWLDDEIAGTLNTLTGQDLPPDWFAWVEWAGQHPEIESFDDYPAWKAALYSYVDPAFLRFVHDGVRVAPGSRVEEIVWGGVPVDGIPALDNPVMIDPDDAGYLIPEERVFGVSINGDTRAYPARFLDWHEMFNDIVGGEPISLAY